MKEDVEELKRLLQEHERRISKLEGVLTKPIAEDKPARRKKLSLNEFLRSKKSKNKVQKALAVGYYLEHYSQLASFNKDDLRMAFQGAKEPPLSNINAFINQNIANGHMMAVAKKKDNKKAYILTSSGEKFVENGFSKQKQ